MCTVKTQKHRFPFIIISTIVPNDTRIHGHGMFLVRPDSTVAHVCFNNTIKE